MSQENTNNSPVKNIESQPFSKPLVLFIISGFIMTGVVLSLTYYDQKNTNQSSIDHHSEFAIAGSLPGAQLYTISKEKVIPIFSLNDKGEKFAVIDQITHKDGTTDYILDANDSPFTSQIYRKYPDGTVTKLTNSKTLKHQLTSDHISGKLAYLSAPITSTKSLFVKTDWNITLLSEDKEKILGSGTQAFIIPGGREVLVVSSSTLGVLTLTTNKTQVLAPLPSGTLVSFDSATKTIALYNTVTKQVDLFTLKSNNSISYTKSISINSKPTALSIKKGEPVVVYTTPSRENILIQVVNLITKSNQAVTIPFAPLSIPSKISFI
jgi:hypothetical protein